MGIEKERKIERSRIAAELIAVGDLFDLKILTVALDAGGAAEEVHSRGEVGRRGNELFEIVRRINGGEAVVSGVGVDP